MGSVKSEGLDKERVWFEASRAETHTLSSCVETCHFPTGHGMPSACPSLSSPNLTTHVTGMILPAVTMVALHSCHGACSFSLVLLSPQKSLLPSPFPWELLLILGPQQGTMMRSPVSRVSQLSQAHSRLEPQRSRLEEDKALGPASRYVRAGL